MDKEVFSKEDILDAIKRSGYLFEQEVGNLLENIGFHIYPNEPFLDVEEGKSREMDISAYKRIFVHDEVEISVRLIIECKNNSNPFVFLKRNKNSSDSRIPRNVIFLPSNAPALIKNYIRNYSFNTAEGDDYTYKHMQFCKITRNGKKIEAQHSGVIDGIIYPQIKALNYYKEKTKNLGRKYITVIIPVVVINSGLYEIDTSKKELEIDNVEYVTFQRSLDSNELKGKFHIDFVSFESLGKYINICIEEKIRRLGLDIITELDSEELKSLL